MPSGSPPPKKGRLANDFENFKDMCARYDGGPQLYVPYKLTSSNAHPSYTGAMAYLVPETGQLSATAVTDGYAHLVDSTRCLIQAGHAFAPLLADRAIADAVGRAEATLGMQFTLWRRLP